MPPALADGISDLGAGIVVAIAGVLMLAYGIILNVFNPWATRWATSIQSLSESVMWWPRTKWQVAPAFVRGTGIYVGLVGLALFITGLTMMFSA